MSCSIGEFNRVNYQSMLNKYAYHSMLLCLICKQEWKKIKTEHYLSENNIVMTESDNAEVLKAEFDMEIQP